jgi:aerobic C4-dicarboxylate transport protein
VIVAGILVGWLAPSVGAELEPLADLFIKLIKTCIAPIIFSTVVLGIAHVGDMGAVGRIGVKALVHFELVTTFALLFGLVVGNVVRPGAGFRIDQATLATGAEAVAKSTGSGKLPHTVEFLMGVVPASVIQAFAENSLLQVLFFAVLFGLALATVRGRQTPILVRMIDQASQVSFTIIGWIMKLPRSARSGAMAYIIGQYGIGSLGSYAKLIAACYVAALLFILVLGAIVAVLAG